MRKSPENSDVVERQQHREFLLKDFDLAASRGTAWAQMRLGALGASITVLALVLSIGRDATYPGVLGIWLVSLGVVFAAIRMIAAMNRALYVFLAHQSIIEDELGEVGFANYWTRHILRDVQDSGAAAFLIACRFMNVAVSAYVASFAIVMLLEPSNNKARLLVLSASALFAIVSSLLNEIHMRHQLDPRGFLERIREDLVNMRKQLRSERGRIQEPLNQQLN